MSNQNVLRDYLEGRLSTAELDGSLSEAEYDDAVRPGERDLLAAVRLVIIDEGEGAATKEDVLASVAQAVAAMTPDQTVEVQRASASTSWWPRTAVVTALETPVVRGHISTGMGAV